MTLPPDPLAHPRNTGDLMPGNEMIRIPVSDTRTVYLPANRLRLDDLRIEAGVWTYTLRVGQLEPLAEETP